MNNLDPILAKKPSPDEECIDYSGYPENAPLAEKVAWLKANGSRICEEHLESVPYEKHQIKNPNDITATATSKYTRSVSDIETEIAGFKYYDKWLSFDVDGDRNPTSIRLITDFREWPSCYSIPLIRSIIKKHKPDSIHFRYATVSGVNTIMIEVIIDNQPIKFLDYSNEPRFLPLTPDEIVPF